MDLFLLSPEIALIALALVVIFVDLFTPEERKPLLAYLSIAGLAVPAALSIALVGRKETSFAGTLVVDPLALFFKLFFLAVAAWVVLSSVDFVRRRQVYQGEYYGLVLIATAGMMLMASTRELITIYISLELTSITLYVLAAFLRRDPKSAEAGVKYMLLGALSSAALLYGLALLYGVTGTTLLEGIAYQLSGGAISPAAILALVFVVAGFGFKIASVPFHMWVPDVYEGAPTPVTAFLSVGSKAAGFVVILRVFATALGPLEGWPVLFAIVAAVTMSLGNLAALRQDNIKRLLGYSSIAQAGYATMALAAASLMAGSSLLFFLVAYAVTNLGAFAAVIAFSNQIGSDRIQDYSGLIRRAPWIAIVLTICFLSLAGVPPLAGFISKVYLFAAVYESQRWVWLVVVAVLNSAVSMYYYMRVVNAMWLGAPAAEGKITTSPSLAVALATTLIAVFLVGIYPSRFMEAAEAAARVLFP